MNVKARGTVTLPRRPFSGLAILPWCRDVNRALQQLRDRTTSVPASGRKPGGGGIILPFEISVTVDSLIAAAGTITGDSHATEVNTTMTNGTWYFRAKVVINSSTGAITSTDVLWSTSEAANTSTDFYLTVGQVDVVLAVPDGSTISQYTYGPLLVQAFGSPTDKWAVSIF